MSTVSFESKTGNHYIASLQSLMEEKRVGLEWLVIAHNDPTMIRRVAEVTSDKSAAMLRIEQGSWDLDGDALPEVIDWSISVAGIRHLLLVGHSKGASRKAVASWISDGTPAEQNSSRSSSNRLLENANRAQQEIQRSQDHFVARINRLGEIQAVREAIGKGELHLHALFYLSHCGTFQIFDLAKQTFRPITG